jgi:hypothetical protein
MLKPSAIVKLSLDVPTTSIIFCVVAVLFMIVPLASPHPPVSEPTIVATLPKWCEAYHRT